jgi:spore germination protein GerM
MARSKKRASLGVLFWIAFILFILVVFLFNRSNIQDVLERTQLVDVVRDRVGLEPEEPSVEVTVEEGEEAQESSEDSATDDSVEVVVEPPAETQPREVPEPEPVEPLRDTAEEKEEVVEREPEEEASESDVMVESQPRPNIRTARIYFIRVTDEGRILPHEVERDVAYRDSPMTETLRVLLDGPTSQELNLGLLNLIPPGTQLLSAAVRDGTAFLNFNEAFKFNTMGAEGAIAQLQQVVFSSTEFSTVSSVQILIEGERLDYLGGEGIYIGDPLDRNSFG